MNVRLGVLAAVAIGVLTGLLAAGIAGGAEAVAVLREIGAGQGEIRVKLAGEADWKAPQPLLSLRPGDQVRASADARAMILFTGRRNAQVRAPAAAGPARPARDAPSAGPRHLRVVGRRQPPLHDSRVRARRAPVGARGAPAPA